MIGPQVKTITIYDFQGFPRKAVPPIELGGKNLLLYGENGSGKSTIFTALAELLNRHPTREFNNNPDKTSCLKHRFSDAMLSEGKIALNFTAGPPMEWLISHPRPGDADHSYHLHMSRSSGFLDYRAILKTHFLDYDKERINLFSLVVETLLRDVELPTDLSLTTFGEEWVRIRKLRNSWAFINATDPKTLDPLEMDQIGFEPSFYRGEDEGDDEENGAVPPEIDIRAAFRRFVEAQRQEVEDSVDHFVEKLRQRLEEIQALANEFLSKMLSRFEPRLELVFDLPGIFIPTDREALRATGWDRVELPLQAKFRGQLLRHPGTLLNEARLTAIAVTIYLAALKVETPTSAPRTAPRLLVLDDVLIGLDMAHRRPVLALLTEEFSRDEGWQVMLFTYDRAWYEIARQELPDTWKRYEMFSVSVGDYEKPVLVPDNDFLFRAVEFLEIGEVKAAAVHVRSKFEMVVKGACAKNGLPVKYATDPNKIPASDFWSALKSATYKCERAVRIILTPNGFRRQVLVAPIQFKIVEKQLADRIDGAISWVMNPLSHSQSVERYKHEILAAIYDVEELECQIERAGHFRDKPSPHQNLIQTLQAIIIIKTDAEIANGTD